MEPNMSFRPSTDGKKLIGAVFALGDSPVSQSGGAVQILTRSPIGHYSVPTYQRGKAGTVKTILEPAAIDNEEESFGRHVSFSSAITASRSR
jgi:hypothetical protein